MALDNKISNIIGAKLPQWVLNQLGTRSFQNNQDYRDNNNILYLANKTAWVRLVSSVDIVDQQDQNYFKTTLGVNIQDKTTLAKEFVLFGGTSKYLNKNSYQIRSGIGKDGAYGMLGDDEIKKYGYKPMPGITSVNIETQGRLGSVRAATVNFKCWDKSQLDIIDALYFKLGFTMFLEWGHTYFYPSFENNQKVDPNKIQSTELYSIDPFEPGLSKEKVFFQIAQNSRKTEGNYDAMLGMVTNFNFTYTQDGGYDCVLRIMSLGILGDSIKINNAPTLPNLLQEQITRYNNTLARIQKAIADAAAKNTSTSEDSEFPDCVTSIPGAKINNLSENAILGKGFPAKALDSKAVYANVNNIGYYFYKNGKWQTSGLSVSGSWKCISGVLHIDGKEAFADKFTYQSVLNKAKNPTSLESSLQERYYLIEDQGNYDYFAIDKFKNLLPIDSNKEIIATLNLATVEKLPSFSSTGNSFIDLLLNVLDKTKNDRAGFLSIGTRQFAPLNRNDIDKNGNPKPVSTDLNSGIGIRYTVLENLQEGTFGNEDYDVEIEYSGLNRKPYSIRLQYDYSAKADATAGWTVKASSKQEKIQDAIKVAVVNNQTQWKITSVENTPYRNSLNNNENTGTFIAETEIKVLINESKLEQIGTDSSGKPINKIVYKDREYRLLLKLTFSDLSILSSFSITDIKDLISPKDAVNPNSTKQNLTDQNQVQNTNTEEQNTGQSTDPTQTKQAITSQSAIELILRAIEIRALDNAITKANLDIGKQVQDLKLYEKDQLDFLNSLFSTGIMASFIKELAGDFKPVTNTEYENAVSDIDRFKIHTKYGFATSLLGNKENIEDLVPNNYKETLIAYAVPYEINQEIQKGTNIIHPVYIPFSLLIMVLNHSCTIYDTKKTFQTPLVYIDYNNNLNFFLSNAQQLSTNPFVTMIPYEGTSQDFKSLFDSSIIDGGAIKALSGSTETMPIFNTQEDALSDSILRVKSGDNSSSVYRGKIMNVLLNVEYIIKLVQDYSYKDGSNNVYLKPFLEQILFDINKYLGDFNSFRLSYNDQANTFQIVDDQFVPSPYSKEVQINPTNRTEIPLFGKLSIAKSLEIKTDISSRLANMIAISSNSTIANKSTLSTNGDSVGYINTNYVDRYIVDKLEISGSSQPKEAETLKISARHFNQTIKDFYSTINPSEANVSDATNYYIEKMSKVKNDTLATRASTLIPVSINFTTDGISGLGMGQAFTVNEELLPYTYATKKIAGMPKDYINNVGFVMVGLNHTIDANAWNTTVRANMIFVKDKTLFNPTASIPNSPVNQFGINLNNNNITYYTQTFYTAKGPDAKKSAEAYLGRAMTDIEWSQLVAATFAEASSNQTERGWVMAVILNRTRTRYLGAQTITDTLTKQNQFQAVTGTSANGRRPSSNYTNGPDSTSEQSIYGAAVQILTNVPKNYLFFTSNNPAAYGEGTDIGFLDRLKKTPGAQIIGMTVFSTTS